MTSEAPAAHVEVRARGTRIVLEPHNCFACGSLNAHGLQLDLHTSGDRCWTDLALAARFEGWEGIAHGGIVSAILDEVMMWALVDRDVWAVTARMSVEFRQPVRIGQPIHAEGRVLEARRRVVTAEGVLLDAADGTLLARSQGTYVGVPDSRRGELKARYGFRRVPDSETPGRVDSTP